MLLSVPSLSSLSVDGRERERRGLRDLSVVLILLNYLSLPYVRSRDLQTVGSRDRLQTADS